jgi:hypothetical protein
MNFIKLYYLNNVAKKFKNFKNLQISQNLTQIYQIF